MQFYTHRERCSARMHMVLLFAWAIVFIFMASATAEQGENHNVIENARIESLKIHWIAQENPDNQNADDSALSKSGENTSISISISGGISYAPGAIRITIPKDIWDKSDAVGTIGNLTLSIPELSSQGLDFQYGINNKNEYEIVNTSLISTKNEIKIWIGFKETDQNQAIDGTDLVPVELTIEVINPEIKTRDAEDATQSNLQITCLNWTRTIEIEQYQQLSESGWILPAGAEVTSRKQEIHHYDTVLDHYETVQVQRSREVLDHYDTSYTYRDMGDGHFEEVEHSTPVYRTEYYMDTEQQPVYVQVPRFQTMFYYTIWRWKVVREETSSGNAHNAAWPELNLASDEREGTHREAYRFTVENTKNKERATYRIAESYWDQLNVNDAVFITAEQSGATPFLSDKDGNKITDLVREQ